MNRVISSYEIEAYAMSLHYDEFDTEGKDQSDLPERINEHNSYVLKKIPLSHIDVPDFYIDDDKVNEYGDMPVETTPPIILGKKGCHLYFIIDGSHRFLALQKKHIKEILAYVPVQD